MNDYTAIGITAISALTAIECVALCRGIDGVVLTTVVSAIVGIAAGVASHIHTKNKYRRKRT